MDTRAHILHLVEAVSGLPPVPAAIVYPCDRDPLQLAVAGDFAGYLSPVLVGPEKRIRGAADAAGLDISRFPIRDTADVPHAAAIEAAALARDGEVAALIKGSLHDADLLAPVAAHDSGLRTERRLSHACFVDIPGRPHGLLVADAHLNIAPTLAAKKDIVLNTIDLAIALGLAAPRVALLAATDSVSHAFPSTADAAALRAMASDPAFRGAVVDGPVTADTALSADAARANGVASDVAGRAEVLIAPTMEAALLVVRTTTGITGGIAAGIVLGARVPVIVPGPADSLEVRMACCVLASLFVDAARRGADHRPAATAARGADVAHV